MTWIGRPRVHRTNSTSDHPSSKRRGLLFGGCERRGSGCHHHPLMPGNNDEVSKATYRRSGDGIVARLQGQHKMSRSGTGAFVYTGSGNSSHLISSHLISSRLVSTSNASATSHRAAGSVAVLSWCRHRRHRRRHRHRRHRHRRLRCHRCYRCPRRLRRPCPTTRKLTAARGRCRPNPPPTTRQARSSARTRRRVKRSA